MNVPSVPEFPRPRVSSNIFNLSQWISVKTIAQSPVATFVAKDQTYQRTPQQIP